MENTMCCIHCGKAIPVDSLFCPKCGKEISKNENNLTKAVDRYRISHQESDFSIIYSLSYKKMYGLIYSKSRDRDITEDVLQSAYIQCFKSIDQLSSVDSFLGWLSTICTRELFHYVKKSNNEILLDEITDDDGNSLDFFDSKADETFELPEKAAEDRALQKHLLKTIEGLPIKQRIAIISYYYNSSSVKDIALEMGVPENTVKTYLSRARKSLAVSVDKYANVNGLKIVPIAIVPFLSLLFRNDAMACEELAGNGTTIKTKIAQAISVDNSNGIANQTAIETAKSTSSKVGASIAASTKGVAAASALVITLAGVVIGGTIINNNNSSNDVGNYVSSIEGTTAIEDDSTQSLSLLAKSDEEDRTIDIQEMSSAETSEELLENPVEEMEDMPKEKVVDLDAIWGDTDVNEYIDPDLNVHFYLPTTVAVRMEPTTGWETTGYSVYVTGEGMQNEYLMTTGAETLEVSLNSDAASSYEVFQDVGNMQYRIYPPFVDAWPEPSAAALAFFDKYGQQIIASAWVPVDTPRPYYTLSVGSDDATVTNEPYWTFHGVPSGIDIAQDGKKTFIVGEDIEAGNYKMRVTLGYGSLSIISEQGELLLEKTGIDGAVMNLYEDIVLNKGEKILMDAAPGEALAITFEKK